MDPSRTKTNQNDVQPFLGQGECVGFPDAVGGTGDEGPLSSAVLDVERPRHESAVNERKKAKAETAAEVDQGRQADVLHSGL